MSVRGWTQERRLWLPALALLLVSLVAYGVYSVFLADNVEAQARRLERARASHDEIVAQRQQAETMAKRAERNERRLVRLYTNRFQTEEARITKMIAEVKNLAQRAGLDPPRISYPEQEIESYGLRKRSIVFSVDGTYPALRRFVNFLELTDSFITLEELRPNENYNARSSRLSISLRLSTLFVAEELDPVRLARSKESLEDLR